MNSLICMKVMVRIRMDKIIKKKIRFEETKTNKIIILSLMQHEIDERSNKDKCVKTNMSMALEFIGTLMENEEANSKASASLDTATTCSGC